MRGRQRHGAGGLHRLPLHDQGPGISVGARRDGDRRAPDRFLLSRGRSERRSARGVRRAMPEGVRRRRGSVLAEADALLTRNRIFVDRMSGTGKISAEDAISYGITGPFLRATGVDYDVRKDCPYAVYDRLEFDVPVGTRGDNFDRYLVRMEEMEQSMRIIEQALRDIPPGPFQANPETGRPMPAAEMVDQGKIRKHPGHRRCARRDRSDARGFGQAPAREHRGGREAGVPASQGRHLRQHRRADAALQARHVRPWRAAAERARCIFRWRGRTASWGSTSSATAPTIPTVCASVRPASPSCRLCPKLLIGDMMADLTPTFGSVNMIGGELDR